MMAIMSRGAHPLSVIFEFARVVRLLRYDKIVVGHTVFQVGHLRGCASLASLALGLALSDPRWKTGAKTNWVQEFCLISTSQEERSSRIFEHGSPTWDMVPG